MNNNTDQAFPGVVTFMDGTIGPNGFWYNGRYHWVFRGGADDKDDSASGQTEGETDSQEDTSKDQGGTDTEDKDKSGEEKTFTQEELNQILAKEKNKALRGKLDPKELGFESRKELDEFIKATKEKSDKEKTEAEKQLEAKIAEATEEAKKSVLSKAQTLAIKAEFKIQAKDAGIKKDALDDAFVLAQTLEFWSPEVNDDTLEVTGFDQDFFDELKEKKPFLFASDEEREEGKPGDAGVGARGGTKGAKAQEEKIRELFPALRQ